MMDILSTKEIIKHGTFQWDSQGNEKGCFYFFAFTIDILIRNENTKKLFEIILHVE